MRLRLGRLGCLGVATLVVASASVAHASPSHDSTRPSTYIEDYFTRGKDCTPWSGQDWVYWNTYVSGGVSRNWITVASKKTLCTFAEKTARHLTPSKVTGVFFPQSFSLSANGAVRKIADPPKGWSCFRLPSGWARNAFSNNKGFAAAQGVTAPYGLCKSIEKKNILGAPHGEFFAWGPAPGNCQFRLVLKTHDDPKDPRTKKHDPLDPPSQVYPSYDEIVGSNPVTNFYNRTNC